MDDDRDVQRYRDLMRRTPPPTTAQIRAFADWVSDDHSWYKKLPFAPPGEAFFFYLDPHLMQVPQQDAAGRVFWKDVVAFQRPDDPSHRRFLPRFKIEGDPDEQEIWSYAVRGLATRDRLDRLGPWDYWNDSYPGQPREEAVAAAATRCVVRDDDATPLPVPHPVLERGQVYLRGTVSPVLGGDAEDACAEARRRFGLPAHRRDRETQLRHIRAALGAVVDWIYER